MKCNIANLKLNIVKLTGFEAAILHFTIIYTTTSVESFHVSKSDFQAPLSSNRKIINRYVDGHI